MEMPPNRIRALREERGLSQVDVAALCGVKTPVTVDRWETGETVIPTKYVVLLASEFDASTDHLLGLDVEGAVA